MSPEQELEDLGAPPCGCIELDARGYARGHCSCMEVDQKMFAHKWCVINNKLVSVLECPT